MQNPTTSNLVVESHRSSHPLLPWIIRGLELSWLLTIVLVPLAFVTPGDLISASAIAYLEVPKVALLRTLVGLMAILWIVEVALQGQLSPKVVLGSNGLRLHWKRWPSHLRGWLGGNPRRWLSLAVGLYLISTLISTVLSTSFDVSMWGEVPGEDGYATYTILCYVLLFAVIATHVKTLAQMWRLLGAVVAIGVLVAGFAMLQHYGYDVFNLRYPQAFRAASLTRATSTMGNPILAGSVMLMTITVSVAVAAVTLRGPIMSVGFWWKLCFWTLMLTVQGLGIYFADSQGPWTATVLAVASIPALAFVFLGWRYLLRIGLILALFSALTSAVIFIPPWLQGEDTSGLEMRPDSLTTEAASTTLDERDILNSASNRFASRGLSGRLEIWGNSWQLMCHRPWFEFDRMSLSFIRPVIGYGPELFRYAYLLESSPRGVDLIPPGAVHAHNYFIHQGVELGFVGLLSSIGVFVALFLVVIYQLVRRRTSYSSVSKLVLIGLLATMLGRLLEQMVGLARVSDLTIFWVLLGIIAALPVVMRETNSAAESPLSPAFPAVRPRLRSSRDAFHFWAPRFLRITVVAILIGGIASLTWVKTVNNPRAGVLAAKGVEQSRQGELSSALSSLNKAIDLAPDVWINYQRLAVLYSALGNDHQAAIEWGCASRTDILPDEVCLAERRHLSTLVGAEQRPFNFRARHALAQSSLELAKLNRDEELQDQSVRLFSEVIALVPAAWPLYNQLATAYMTIGQPRAALEPLGQSLAITGDHLSSHKALFLRGVVYRDLGESTKAIEQFSEAIRLSPQLETYNNRAMTYWLIGEPDLAIDDLNVVIGWKDADPDDIVPPAPDYAEVYSNRGFVFRDLGLTNKAIEDLNEAIRLDPQFPVAYNNRGLAYSDLGRYQLAIEDYARSISLDPKYVQAYVNRAVAYLDLDQPERAVRDATDGIALDPNHAGAYAARSLAYTLIGRDTEAIPDFTRAVELGMQPNVLESKLMELQDGG